MTSRTGGHRGVLWGTGLVGLVPALVHAAEPPPRPPDPPIPESPAQPAAPDPTSGSPEPSGAPPGDERPKDERAKDERPKLPPIRVDYAIYGIAFAADFLASAGATCSEEDAGVPCILGSGGGVVLRGGYRSPGPWYIGGAYQFTKTDSANLYRLGILQQLRAEMRYMFDLGYRFSPYATWGLGGMVYGNEWGVETGGATLLAGVGVELQLSRLAVLGMSVTYRPMLIAGWTDTASFSRDTGVAQYVGVELQLEVRSQLSRR